MKSLLVLIPLLTLLGLNTVNAQTPVPMASQGGLTYTENFADITNWTNGFASGAGANRWGSVAINATGTIPDGSRTSASTASFVTGSSGGVQKGTLNIVMLSTGATDNTSACAIDFFLDFTGVNAGTLSFDWATVFNSTGDRASSIRVYTSTNGTTFNELTGAAVLNKANNVAASGSITTVALPASFNNSATARIRFYEYNGAGGTTGSRAKISLDNVTVTATAVAPTKLAITSISPASPTQNSNFSVTVQAQDAGNIARNVVANTNFTLSVATGTGAIGGTFSGTINAGSNSATLNSVTYNTAESGVSLTATRTSGDVLTAGTSSTFTVLPAGSPTITIVGTLSAFSTAVGVPSAVQSYSVSGVDLTANITITPPTGFEIMQNGVGSFSSSPLILAHSGGIVGSTQIDVRYNPASAGSSGALNISHTTTGDSKNQAVSGFAIETQPTTASTVTFGTTLGTSMVVNFNGGNGARRIVVMRAGSAVTYTPTDGASVSGTVSSVFTTATDQGSGDRIVYDNTGNTVTVTGLSLSTTYHVAVYEYNGTGTTANYYLTAGTGNNLTLSTNAIAVPMASQPGLSYTENFADIANWTNDFASGIGASRWGSVAVNATGTIPDGVRTTVSTAAFNGTSTSGGLQRGGLAGSSNPVGTIVQLSTGANDFTSANAIDLFLNFTGVNAGTLSFDWATVFNSTGDRASSLRVYTTTDGITFTELSAAAVLNKANNVAASGSITNVALPASFTNSATARIRFYEFNGTGGTGGSRAKIALDNVTVTATLPTKLAITSFTPATPVQNANFSVTVQSQDASNTPQNVLTNTNFTLSLNTGTGVLGGTLTGTILAGTNQAVVSNVTYSVAETGVIITATRTNGDILTAGNSASFTVDPPATPTITLTGTLSAFLTGVGTQSTPSQTYTVEGADLTANLVIAPPAQFEVSTDDLTWVANPSTLNLTPVGVAVAPTTIYVRYAPGSAGPHSGNIVHTSTGAVTKNQAVSGATSDVEPTTSGTITFSNLTATSALVNFGGGNGARKILVARQTSAVSFVPTDGVGATGVDSDFGLATDQGSGNKIVYDGTGTSVTVTNLTSGSTYHFAVYDYNGLAGTSNYRATAGTGSTALPSPIPYNGGTYTQNFNSLPTAGSFSFAGQGSGPFFTFSPPISASSTNGWQIAKASGLATDAKFAFDNGGGTTASAYSYGTTSDRALGSLAGGQVVSRLGAVITNNTGGPLSVVTITYTGEQWRDGGSTNANTLSFSYALGGTDISTGTFTSVSDLNFGHLVHSGSATTLDGNLPANRAVKTATFCVGNWAPGQTLVIRWDDADEIGGDDGLGIDDFSFSASGGVAPSCVTAQANNTSCITSTTLSWASAGTCESYYVYVATDNPMTNFIVYQQNVGTALTFDLPLLQANTPYYYQIVPFNDFGDAVGCSINTFTSGGAQDVTPNQTVNSYTLGSEGTTIPTLPCGVTKENFDGMGSAYWYSDNTAPKSGSNHLRIDKNADHVTDLDDWFFSPPINVVNGRVYRITWFDRIASGSANETYRVYIAPSADASTMSGTSFIYSGSTNSTTYTQRTASDYLATSTGQIYFGFRAMSTAGVSQSSLFLDDIQVIEIPVAAINPAYCTTIPSMYDQIFVQPVSGATNYRFKIVGTGGQSGYNFEHYRNNANIDYRLKWAPGVIYGYTYNVSVGYYKNGAWSPYGASCPVTLGPFPASKLRNNPLTVAGPCDYVISDLNQQLFADSVSGSNDYMYKIVEDVPGGPYDYDHTWQRYSGNLDYRLVWGYQASPLVERVQYGYKYDVQVRSLVGKTGANFGNRPGEWGPYGTTCKLDLTAASPTTSLSTCGVTLTSLNDQIFATPVSGATNYQYEITGPGYFNTAYRNNGNNDFRLTWVPSSPAPGGVSYATTYSIRVRAYVGGAWLNYGAACNVTTPAAPTSSVPALCGATLTTGSFSTLYSATAVPGATQYAFRFTNVGGVAYSKIIYNYSANNTFTLSRTVVCCGYQNMLPNAQYTVEVAYFAGTWSAYGPACTFTTGPTVPRYSPFNSESTAAAAGALNLAVYPNPASVNEQYSIQLDGITAANEKVEVRIFNLLGDKVYNTTVVSQEDAAIILKPEVQLAAGVYMAEAQYNGNVTRVKFVVK